MENCVKLNHYFKVTYVRKFDQILKTVSKMLQNYYNWTNMLIVLYQNKNLRLQNKLVQCIYEVDNLKRNMIELNDQMQIKSRHIKLKQLYAKSIIFYELIQFLSFYPKQREVY